jgi:hypothetical protein
MAMSFSDRLVLWLHIAFAIFTIGPLALAISSTPRYIRNRDVAILRYLTRITTIFTVGSLLVLIFGIILGQIKHDFSHPWLTAAMTLFLVAIVLLVLIMRDQRRAIKAVAEFSATQAAAGPPTPDSAGQFPASGTTGSTAGAPAEPGQAGDQPAGTPAGSTQAAIDATSAHIAAVERGRIAAMGGVVNLIWLVILVLMVWQP